MSELIENRAEKLKANIEISLSDIKDLIEGIGRCCDRLERLIELKPPMPVIKRECEIIQYRALIILAMFETLALLNFVYKKE